MYHFSTSKSEVNQDHPDGSVHSGYLQIVRNIMQSLKLFCCICLFLFCFSLKKRKKKEKKDKSDLQYQEADVLLILPTFYSV